MSRKTREVQGTVRVISVHALSRLESQIWSDVLALEEGMFMKSGEE